MDPMYEIDFLPVGDGKDSGDAIAMRFTRPDTGTRAVVVIDAGFQDDGEALVEHIPRYYDTDVVDLAILTHPDGDHIGGMGELVRGLDVKTLWLHDIGAHGGGRLPAAAAVDELIEVARAEGTAVEEPWAGASAFGGALTVLGPDRNYYTQLVAEQLEEGVPVGGRTAKMLEATRGLWDRTTGGLPVEIPLAEKHVNPRNNSSIITMLQVDGRRSLLTADAGVPALSRAWDVAEILGIAGPLRLVQVPHHGSRRNVSSAWLDRLLGTPGENASACTAVVSAVAESDKHPSGRVVNAHIRRGCQVHVTAGNTLQHHHNAPARSGWGPASPLPPMAEDGED